MTNDPQREIVFILIHPQVDENTVTHLKILQTALEHQWQSLWDFAHSEFGQVQVLGSLNPKRRKRVEMLASTFPYQLQSKLVKLWF